LSKGLVETVTDVFRPQAPLWGCELTSKHVIVAGVAGRRNQIAGKAVSDLPQGCVVVSQIEANIQNADAARGAIRDILKHTGFKGSEVAVVVPDDTARIAFLTADRAAKNPEEQQTFIRWKLKKTVPFDIDSAQLAYRVIGPHRGHGVDILVAISPRSIVQEYENLFDSIDLHAGLVLPSTLAALNLFEPPAGDTLFLKVAPDCITTTIFQDQRIRFYRRVTDATLYDAVYPTVMYYQDKLGGKAIEHLCVCGYDFDLRAQLNEVQEKLGWAPERLQPITVDDIYKPALGSVHLSWHSLI
jgi:type IV pilus assembly protein PilM